MQYRKQKNITISQEQLAILKENVGKVTNTELSKIIGVGYHKTMRNMIIAKIYVPEEIKPIEFWDKRGNFDVDKFSKLYKY